MIRHVALDWANTLRAWRREAHECPSMRLRAELLASVERIEGYVLRRLWASLD